MTAWLWSRHCCLYKSGLDWFSPLPSCIQGIPHATIAVTGCSAPFPAENYCPCQPQRADCRLLRLASMPIIKTPRAQMSSYKKLKAPIAAHILRNFAVKDIQKCTYNSVPQNSNLIFPPQATIQRLKSSLEGAVR